MNIEMDALTDPTGFAAMRLYNKSKYEKVKIENKPKRISKPINRENFQIKVAMAKAMNKNFETAIDKYISEGSTKFKLNASGKLNRIFSVEFDKPFRNSHMISVKSIKDNVVEFNEEVPKNILVKICYSYRIR